MHLWLEEGAEEKPRRRGHSSQAHLYPRIQSRLHPVLQQNPTESLRSCTVQTSTRVEGCEEQNDDVCTEQSCLLQLLLLLLSLSRSLVLPNSLLYRSISVWCSPIFPLHCSLSPLLSDSQLCLGARCPEDVKHVFRVGVGGCWLHRWYALRPTQTGLSRMVACLLTLMLIKICSPPFLTCRCLDFCTKGWIKEQWGQISCCGWWSHLDQLDYL